MVSETAGPVEEIRRQEERSELRTVFAEYNEPSIWRRRPVTSTQKRVLGFTWIGIMSMGIYGLFMVLSFLSPGYTLLDRISSVFLILGLLFILVHGFGYANSMLKAAAGYNELRQRVFSPVTAPKVCCVVACFNEPAAVLEETIAALNSLDYPNKEIVVLDDSTQEEAREASRQLGAKYGARVVQRTNRRGYKAGAINDFLPQTDADFIAIFDADALPAHNFLRDMVPVIEENPRIAFVQTPQYYANTNVSGVALAAARQQSVFYEYICEGKSHSRAMFCCGTNVIFRRQALLDVKGFDEKSVTEDFATSLNLHLKGYDSAYYNQVYVYSLAPETLASYFTQQSRWSFGSVGAMRKVLGSFFRRPGAMRWGQWWEYFLSSTYYWIGWVNFIFMLLPMLYIFFNIKPLRADVFSYMAVFVPYFIFTMNMFYLGMEERGYRVMDMLLGQQIGFLCFPIHMSSAIAGILGRKRPFGVTPKGIGGRLSLISLWPQLLMMFLSALAFVWGMFKYLSGADRNTSAIVINAIWALYHVVLLSGLFRLNRRVYATESKPYFAREPVRIVRPSVQAATAGAVAGGTVGATEERVVAPPAVAPRGLPRAAFYISLASLLVVAAIVITVGHWYLIPATSANVYVVDRTTGRDYQEHRGLDWTLNFLKIRHDGTINPAQTNDNHQDYRFAEDFYGFIPGEVPSDPAQRRLDDTLQAKYLVGGSERALPDKFDPNGVVFLADTYGQFVEWDPGLRDYVRYVDERGSGILPHGGLTPEEIDRIQAFYDNQGLLVAEWNTIGYPTLPGEPVSTADLEAGLASTRKGLTDLRLKEAQQQKALAQANASGNAAASTQAQTALGQTQEAIKVQEQNLANIRQQTANSQGYNEQLAAQRRLEKMLHVHYKGWYGRYVDKFEDEHEFDFRMWKNASNKLKDKYPKGLRGPGFVFYRDGASEIENIEDKKQQKNPFSEPIIILQDELPDGPTSNLANIYVTGKAPDADDALLKEVSKVVPCRFWFDVVEAQDGGTVLAWYKLRVKQSAADRLTQEGFPGAIKSENGVAEIMFPAAVSYRDTKLRSFYFAGDASDYPLVSKVNEMFPATGGISYQMAHRVGSYPTQYYWNYYEPLVRNIFAERYQKPGA